MGLSLHLRGSPQWYAAVAPAERALARTAVKFTVFAAPSTGVRVEDIGSGSRMVGNNCSPPQWNDHLAATGQYAGEKREE